MTPGHVQDDLGPALPPRVAVHVLAGDLLRAAQRARELSSTGPGADLRLAVAELERMRAMLGPSAEAAMSGGGNG
jgi:hypothetical protein